MSKRELLDYQYWKYNQRVHDQSKREMERWVKYQSKQGKLKHMRIISNYSPSVGTWYQLQRRFLGIWFTYPQAYHDPIMAWQMACCFSEARRYWYRHVYNELDPYQIEQLPIRSWQVKPNFVLRLITRIHRQ